MDDLLKMKLQLLQFQTDVSQAKLARVQGLSDLRQLLGYEQVSAEYDVAGSFDYQPMKGGLEDLQATALKSRPDLQAAAAGGGSGQQPVQSAEGDRQAGRDRADQLHAPGLSERRFAFRVDATADLRPQPGRDQARRVRDYAGAGAANVRERAGADGREGRIRRLAGERRDRGAVSLRLSRRGAAVAATSRNTRTSTAPPACWIFWMRNGVIGQRNSATGRRWHRICWRWSSFARR